MCLILQVLNAFFVKLKFSEIPTLVLCLVSIAPMLVGEIALKYWPLSVIAVTIILGLWAYSVTRQLTARIKFASTKNFTKFRVALIFATAYIILLSFYYYFFGSDKNDPGWILLVIIIGQLALCYCFFYLLVFISKSIAMVDFEKPVNFSEFANYFFCLFFFPIGIWWVNSKIRDALAKPECEFHLMK